MQFDIIVAVDSEFGIAKNGDLPWKNTPAGREDMNWFKERTSEPGTAVIMGRKTWESIPEKFRPLKGRINVVISSQYVVDNVHIEGDEIVVRTGSFERALNWCDSAKDDVEIKNCMVIGGKSIYEQALKHPRLHRGYITLIQENYNCDVKIDPRILRGHQMWYNDSRVDKNKYLAIDYSNREESEYIRLLYELKSAPLRKNRTGVPTRGVFHRTLKFKLFDPVRNEMVLPLLTTKKVPWKSVYHENIWFLSGKCTNTKYLKKHGVPIWDGNSTREFLDKQGLNHYEEGELGPIYGYQWRQWNRTYLPTSAINNDGTYDIAKIIPHGVGIDQITNVINKLKTDPWDRRMIVSAWNPEQIDEMALPACHYSFQFHVDPDENGDPKYLNCLVNMRSADTFLGVPFNIAAYSFITHIIAHIVGFIPGELSISMCDCHIYENAIEKAEIQLTREPRRFPTIRFSDKILNTKNIDIENFVNDFTIDDYIIEGYDPHPFIKCDMVV